MRFTSLRVSSMVIPTTSSGTRREVFLYPRFVLDRQGKATRNEDWPGYRTVKQARAIEKEYIIMNRCYYVVLLSCMVGCATTSQIEESNNRIRDLEEKIARVEGDLYRVEVKSAPKQQAAEPKFVPAKEVEQNVIDTKIDAFLKEYLGIAFGDSIEQYPQTLDRCKWLRVIPVLKKFQYFDKALASFYDGKLYSVEFFADIDVKYSIDSTNERIDQALADMAVTFGIASDSFKGPSLIGLRRNREATSSYSLDKCNDELAPKGFRRRGAKITNRKLFQKLEKEKRARECAAGEQLPELK